MSQVKDVMAHIASIFSPCITLDLRSLALMRVLSCIVALIDLASRFAHLPAQYGATSVMPPEALTRPGVGHVPLQIVPWLLQHIPYFPHLLLIATACAVFMVLIGYQTRASTIVAWVGILLIQSMNLLVLFGADTMVRLVFFFGIFLPWGAYFSLDRALSNRPIAQHRTALIWSFAFLVQISCIYFFAALIKSKGAAWQDGTAVYYALSTDLATPLGVWLLHLSWLLPFLAEAVRLFQLAIPFLIFFPIETKHTRTIAMCLLLCMHFAFAFIFYIGIFSWISIALVSGLTPSAFWTFLLDQIQRRFGTLTIYYDGDCGFCKYASRFVQTFLVPQAQVYAAQESADICANMRLHDSWVVANERGNRFFTYSGAVAIIEHSPFLFFLAPLLRMAPLRSFGERTYRFIANRRSRTCALVDVRRPVWPQTAHAASRAFAVFVVVSIILVNVHSVFALPLSHRYMNALNDVGLTQNWKMFSPNPISIRFSYRANGITNTGTRLQVFAMPESYLDSRWHKYLQQIGQESGSSYRRYFLSYLCQSWNESHNPMQQVRHIDLIFTYSPILPDYQQTREITLPFGSIDCTDSNVII